MTPPRPCALLLAGLLFAGVRSPAVLAAAPPERPAPTFLTIAQIMRTLEASPNRFAFRSTDELGGIDPAAFAETAWPESTAARQRPADPDCRVASERLVSMADELYFSKNTERALATFQEAVTAAPNCSSALDGVARCLARLGRKSEALDFRRHAVDASPKDDRLRFFLGMALLEAGRAEEALEQLTEALVLRPRQEFALASLEAKGEALGVSAVAEAFLPKAVTREETSGIQIYTPTADPSGVAWTAWGSCKALWIGDEAHRLALTGDARHGFTTTEELECLAALLTSYDAERAVGSAPADAQLDRLQAVAKDGLITELVAYEMASRVVPDAMLRLDDAQLARVREYVRRHVVLKHAP